MYLSIPDMAIQGWKECFPAEKGKVIHRALWSDFISSIPARCAITMAVRGRYQAYVETEGGAGAFLVPFPGIKRVFTFLKKDL